MLSNQFFKIYFCNFVFVSLTRSIKSIFLKRLIDFRFSKSSNLALCLTTFLVFSCLSEEQSQISDSEYDFLSTPVVYKIVSEQRDEKELLSSKKTYEFETCLKDRLTLMTAALTNFTINDRSYVSDESGCVVFSEVVEFNPYEQSRPLDGQFVFEGYGRHPGRLVIHYTINPWYGQRPTTTAEFVEILTNNSVATDDPQAITKDQSQDDNLKLASAQQDQVDEINANHAAKDSNTLAFNKSGVLGLKSASKHFFHHNPSARNHQTHWNFKLTPYIELFDANGVASTILPKHGVLNVEVEILTINRQLSLTQKNLQSARTIKKYLFKELKINSGKILLTEKIQSIPQADDQNILLQIALSSESAHAKSTLNFKKHLYFVRTDTDTELLQEINLSDDPTKPVASNAPDLTHHQSTGDYKNEAYYLENPRIRVAHVLKNYTTKANLVLQFDAKLAHRIAGEPLNNLDLYVTYNNETKLIKSDPDGNIKFPFNYEYHFYKKTNSVPELLFNISNKEKTFSLNVPMFLKHWEYFNLRGTPVISIDPNTLPNNTVDWYNKLNIPTPKPFVESLRINQAPDIIYQARKDLSLHFTHSFRFSGTAKLRHFGLKRFGFNKDVIAPDGIYLMEIYLSCTESGLENKSLYKVDVNLDEDYVDVYRPVPDSDKNDRNRNYLHENLIATIKDYGYTNNDPEISGRICPSYKNSVRLVIENGKFTATLEFKTSDPRVLWSKMQLSLVLNPYKTKELEEKIGDTKFTKLHRLKHPMLMADNIILSDTAKKSKSFVLARVGDDDVDTSQNIDFNNSFKDLSEINLITKKWIVADNFYQHLNALDSDYLILFNLNYVSLENKPYSSLFPQIENLAYDSVDAISGLLSLKKDQKFVKTKCSFDGRDCFNKKSDLLNMSFEDFTTSTAPEEAIEFSPKEFTFGDHEFTFGDKKHFQVDNITLDQMRDILWNKPNNRKEDLKIYLCAKWKKDYIQAFNNYITHVNKFRKPPPNIDLHDLMKQDETFKYIENIEKLCYESILVQQGFNLNDVLQESKLNDYRSLITLRHIKGKMTKTLKKEDAGSDVLTMQAGNQMSFGYGINIYSSMHLDFVTFLLTLTRTIGSISGGGLSYQVNTAAEQEVVDGDKSSMGFNHYSHWTTLKLGLKFNRPRYCLSMRINPHYIAQKVHILLYSDFFFEDNLISEHYPYYQVHVLNGFARKISAGYMICTDKTPEIDYDEKDPNFVFETYRLPKPRFTDDIIYEDNEEKYRRWLYPIRGNVDFLKLRKTFNNLPPSKIPARNETIFSRGNFFTRFVTFIAPRKIHTVHDQLLPALTEFSLFPKKYVFDKFNNIAPAVGGFYNFYEPEYTMLSKRSLEDELKNKY